MICLFRIFSLILLMLGLYQSSLGSEPQLRNSLFSIAALDEQEAWAVGDDGLILHTIDRGATWERQKSGTSACLRSIQMLTPYVGFAVGRTEVPGAVRSLGVILHTVDGGATWRELAQSYLPGLEQVHFFNDREGIVVGSTTDSTPTGVFLTHDGGDTWQALRGPRTDGWNGIRAWLVNQGFLYGPNGLGIMKNGSFHLWTPWQHSTIGVHKVGERHLLISESGKSALLDQVGELHARADLLGNENQTETVTDRLRASCHVNESVWVLAESGSTIHHSKDFGASWSKQSTPTQLPLHSITMVNERFGYAVGDLGTILQTQDGGATWQLRQAIGTKIAMLVLVEELRPEHLTLATHYGLLEGYHVAVGTTAKSSAQGHCRVAAAWRSTGGCSAYAWHSKSTEALIKCLHRLQPSVVVAEPQIYSQLQPRFADLQTSSNIRKLVCIEETLDANHKSRTVYLPELLGTLQSFTEPAMRLLAERPNYDAQVGLVGHSREELFQGVVLAERGPGRGTKLMVPTANEQQQNDARRHTLRVLELIQEVTSPEKLYRPEVHVACLKELAGWRADRACEAALQLAERAEALGSLLVARQYYLFMVQQHPLRTETALAVMRLFHLHASPELQRLILTQKPSIDLPEIFELRPGPSQVVQVTALELPSVMTATGRMKFASSRAARQWEDFAYSLEPRLAAFGTAYLRSSEYQLAKIALQRRHGLFADAERGLRALLQLNVTDPSADPIAQRYQDELALLRGGSDAQTIMPQHTSSEITEQLKLDGKLTEKCWLNAKPITLASGVEGQTTTLKITHDDKYLYLAGECVRVGNQLPQRPHTIDTKKRDADLTQVDRVEIKLDINRDYKTFFRFGIDELGHRSDDCSNDYRWNPNWFVATAAREQGWTFEAAIPLIELHQGGRATGETWILSTRRCLGLQEHKPVECCLKFLAD